MAYSHTPSRPSMRALTARTPARRRNRRRLPAPRPARSTVASSKRPADELQAKRQARAVESRRHRDPRQARQARRHGEDIVQIHRNRVVHLLPERGKRRSARSASARHRLSRTPARSHGRSVGAPRLRLGIIGVVIAGPRAHRCRSAPAGAPRPRIRRGGCAHIAPRRLQPGRGGRSARPS